LFGEDRAAQELQRGEVTLRRFAALLTLVVALAFSITGCGGGANTSNNPSTMSITPTAYSLNYGQTLQLSPVVKNYSGNTLSGQTIIYSSSSPTIGDVANGSTYPGLVCGGTWDSETNPVVCHPPASPGVATITATDSNGGSTASATAMVYVHPPVGSIAVGTSETTPLPSPCPTPPQGSSTTSCTCTEGNSGSCTGGSTTCTCPLAGIDLNHCISGALSTPDTTTFTATVCSGTGATPGNCPNGQEITGWVGPLTWTVTPTAVGLPDTTGATCTYTTESNCFSKVPTQPVCNQCILTASLPGQAFVTASAANVASSPTNSAGTAVLTTCPVQKISLTQLASSAGSPTSVSVATDTTTSLSAIATDSKNNQFSSLPTGITYGSSQPAVAAAASTISSGVSGTASLIASCIPPGCNAGMFPVYSNPFRLNVTGTDSSVVYVSSTHTPGTYLVPISMANSDTPSVAITVSSSVAPNSMLIDPTGANIVLGSNNGGVMIYNISGGTTSVTPFNGKVLAVSPDGNKIVVYDVNGSPTAYIYSLADQTTLATIPLQNTTTAHAAFSPDSSIAYVVGSNGSGSSNVLFTWTSNTAPQKLSVATATAQPFNDVAFLPQGSFVYLAGGDNDLSVYSTCMISDIMKGDITASSVATSAGLPTILRTVPNPSATVPDSLANAEIIDSSGARILAVNNPYIDNFAVSFQNVTLPNFDSTTGVLSCTPPAITTTDTPFTVTTVLDPTDPNHKNYITGFTANQLVVTSDGVNALILDQSKPYILAYNLTTNTGFAISITNGATPTSGDATLDGLYLWFGASDNTVHIINLTTATDTTSPISLSSYAPTTFKPDLIAIVP